MSQFVYKLNLVFSFKYSAPKSSFKYPIFKLRNNLITQRLVWLRDRSGSFLPKEFFSLKRNLLAKTIAQSPAFRQAPNKEIDILD